MSSQLQAVRPEHALGPGQVTPDAGEAIRSRLPLRAFWGSLFLVLLAAGLPITLLQMVPTVPVSPAAVIGFLITAYAGARLALLVVSGEKRVLELTFWVYVYVWLGISALLQTVLNQFPWPGEYSVEMQFAALAIVVVGCIAYELGLTGGRRQSRTKSEFGAGARQLSGRRLAALTFASVVLVGILVAKLGGVTVMFLRRNEFQSVLAAFSGSSGKAIGVIAHALITIPVFVALLGQLGIILSRFRSMRRHWKLLSLCNLFILLAANAVVNNPVSSARAWFGTVVIAIALLAVRWRKNASAAFWVAGLVVGFVILFPYMDIFRRSGSEFVGLPRLPEIPSQLALNGDYASYQQILNMLRYVSEQDHTLGRQTLGAFAVWIPRRIWNDKPVDTADLVASYAGYHYTNLEMPLWGELFLDWHIPGVVAGFVFLGWLTGVVQARLCWSGDNRGSLAALAGPVLTGYQLLLLRGDLMSTLTWLLLVIACIWFICPALRARSRRPS